jgi:Zn-dependent protease with chaperone function
MSDLLFPLIAWVVLFAGVIPFLTLVATPLIRALGERTFECENPIHSTVLGWLLIAPALAPIVWTLSALSRQFVRAAGEIECLAHFSTNELCLDPWAFALALAATMASLALNLARAYPRATTHTNNQELARHIRHLASEHPALRKVADRIVSVDDAPFAIGCVGIFLPSILVDSTWASARSDEEIVAAMLHERAHLRAADPARQILFVALARINRASRMHRSARAAFDLSRELACDRFALAQGGNPLALASALVSAARFQPRASLPNFATVRLASPQMNALHARVNALLNVAGDETCRGAAAPPSPTLALARICGMILALGIVVQPWCGERTFLDRMHHSVESYLLHQIATQSPHAAYLGKAP